MIRYAVSSWSLDHLLTNRVALLDLPAQLADRGFSILELCHFHLPTTDAAYLEAFRQRLDETGVQLFSLLIDTGDIATPDPERRARDMEYTQRWIAAAAALGAQRVRIDAGQQPPTSEVIERSAEHLHLLAQYAAAHGVAASTENWHATSNDPAALLAILDACPSPLGLCVDTGNAETTPDKYQTLRQLLPRATSIHFKARYTADGAIDTQDLQTCVSLFKAARFGGVFTLIYGDKHREWTAIELLRATLDAYL